MRILFDNGTPLPLRHMLPGHEVTTVYSLGWHELQNGALLAKAEADGFELFVTTDQNIRYQQNLTGRALAILVLLSTNWRLIRQHVGVVAGAIDGMAPGGYVEVEIPHHE